MSDSRTAAAFRFVVLLGCVSLCADVVYEGARSIAGPFLASLGATATAVGFVSGFGELVGYGLRLITGRLVDRTRKQWAVMFCGYGTTMVAVPALALAPSWPIAACLIFAERAGKAIRSPAKDLVLSDAAKDVGRGTAFGLHTTLDQTGAILGPLVLAAILYYNHNYQLALGALIVPAIAAMVLLAVARANDPEKHEPHRPVSAEPLRLPRAFWLFCAGAGLVAAGLVDFPLIAYHLNKALHVDPSQVPLYYAGAMAVEAAIALPLGRAFDKFGTLVLVGATAVSAICTPLAFSTSMPLITIGVLLWGLAMVAQTSVAKATIAHLVSSEKRGSAYGVFGTIFGGAWFLGSTLMGFLYDHDRLYLIAFSVTAQLLAVPLFAIVARQMHRRNEKGGE